MLTIAAVHVIYDSNDPYFTILQPGEYAKVKPSGVPCDAAFNCYPPHLSEAGTIALAVVITVVGLVIVSLGSWYTVLRLWGNRAKV
jgi:endoglucanase